MAVFVSAASRTCVRSRRMMEEILAKEKEHAEDMKTLLDTIGKAEEVMAEVKPTSSESEPEAQPSKLVFVLEGKTQWRPTLRI